MFEGWIRDLKFSVRLFAKSPVITFVCVLSLALGIGANTAVFTLVNAVFFKGLPIQQPEQLVYLSTTAEETAGGALNYLSISYPNFQDYQEQTQRIFSGLSLYSVTTMNMFHDGKAEQIKGFIVSGNYFDLLGVKPAAGRTFLPEEDRVPGGSPVVVLSYPFWQSHFAGNQDVVGRVLKLNNQSFTVVGVAAQGFSGTALSQPADFWVPMMMHDQVLLGRYHLWFNLRRALLFNVVGRLKPGVTLGQAQTELDIISHRLQKEFPDDNKNRKVTALPLIQATLNPNDRSAYVLAGGLLLSVVSLVLLITCSNLASLLLARSLARRKEIALRTALGARRSLLVRQLLTESLLLSIVGGTLGLVMGWQGSRLFWLLHPPFFSANSLDLSVDGKVLAFTLAVSVITGICFGLMPALQTTKPNISVELREKSTQQSRTMGALVLQRFLLVFEISFSVVALTIAGLLVHSLSKAQHIDLGFESQRLMVVGFSLGAQGYEGPRGLELQRRMREQVESIPGVHSAGFATNQPLTDGFFRTILPEQQEISGTKGALVLTDLVGTGYFESAKIPLVVGRDFADSDRMDAPKVAIVNEAMAKRFWPNQEAVGKRFKFFNENDFVRIVGVVKDSKLVSLREDSRPCVYTPLNQTYVSDVTLYVRTDAQPSAIFHEVIQRIRTIDPELPMVDPAVISTVINQSLWAPRLGAQLVAGFGLVALLLVAVGVYGILAYSVSQRGDEICIRMALGAQTGDILGLVLKQSMVLATFGIGLGLIFSFFAARSISNLLFGIRATDPVSFGTAILILFIVTVLASLIPARRATKIPPMSVIR